MSRATFAAASSPAVVRAASEYPPPTVAIASPVSLTASDGTGLELRSFHAKAVVEGPLAFTELTMVFHNPRDRVIEGRFAIALPDGAAISRLAMEIEGRWQEAEVVERQRARRVYEDFLHRRSDPALLEKEAGNEFRARVFPIPARADKRIVVSFSHELEASDTAYELPLRGLPAVPDLAVSVLRADGNGVYEAHSEQLGGEAPTGPFRIPAVAGIDGLAAGELAVVRVAPAVSVGTATMKRARILFDTSASRAPGFAGDVDRLAALIAGLARRHAGLDVEVLAFDSSTERIYRGPAARFGDPQVAALRARRPLGASNLHGALASLADAEPRERLIVIGDAVATTGETTAGAIAQAARRAAGVERIDVLLAGGIRDRDLAAELVRGTVARDGVVVAFGDETASLVGALSARTVSGVAIDVPGADFVWPTVLDGLQPGDERLVFVALPRPPGGSLRVRLRGAAQGSVEIPLARAARPLIERAVARARIAAMTADLDAMEKDAPSRAPLQQAIVDLSVRHRILSDYTALLVLETERDYQTYGIDRRALSNVLTVSARGVESRSRTDAVIAVEPVAAVEKKEARKVSVAPARPRAAPADRDSSRAGAPPPTAADGIDRRRFAPGSSAPAGAEERIAVEGRAPAIVAPEDDLESESPRADDEPGPGVSDLASGELAGVSFSGQAEAEAEPEPEAELDGASALGGAAAGGIVESGAPKGPPPLTGRLADIAATIARGERERALVEALSWQREEPGDVLALIALGEAVEADGNAALAARVYGSIIDLFPSRADMRRMAAQRLERLGAAGSDLAIDSLEKAVEQRPDHLTGHRQLSFAYVRAGRLADAFAALERGLGARYRTGHANGGLRILREDLGIVGQAWAARLPGERDAIARRLQAAGAHFAAGPSTRFAISWETDANDVDFHIRDSQGNHASYQKKTLPTGGELFADVTNGYGPECFAIEGGLEAAPYRLSVHYYSRGPMGYGMGELEILRHDGADGLDVESRPFVVMVDGAFVELGEVGAGPVIAR